MAGNPKRILVFGASGTIGRACVAQLVDKGHEVIAFMRAESDCNPDQFAEAQFRIGDITNAISIEEHGFKGEAFDAVISCIASRSGAPDDAWAIDYQANASILAAARTAGVSHMILMSAICVQRPRLAFQHAKLAFEKKLRESGLIYSIVRPTAFFKSLSGQVQRVAKGGSFLVFGNGELTSCKPISDRDLAEFVAECLDDEAKHNAVLPIGGPGPAISPLDQANMLCELLGKEVRVRRIPIGLLDTAVWITSQFGKLSNSFAAKAEYARIAQYYATQSMLVLNEQSGLYDPAATPEFGKDTLFTNYGEQIETMRRMES